MPLKAQDLQTFEAYKKAIRAAASQIKDNTPFCLYSDVEIPDASKKAHTLRPFLVVGSPANAITPLLKDLHGGKKPLCSGFCSLESGKISLEAKSGALNYGLFKSQATVFKDLLGKEILIPAAGGAAPAAKPAPMDGIKTEFGLFVYFAKDPKYVSVVKEIVTVFEKASDDLDETNVAYREMIDVDKKVPPADQIMKWINEGDPTGSSGNAARIAKASYQNLEKYRSGMADLQEDIEYTVASFTAALKQLMAEQMDDAAKQLKKQAEEEKEKIDQVVQFVKIAIDAAKEEVDPTELIKDGLEVLGKAVGYFATKNVLKQAEELEKQAHELKIGAFTDNITSAVKHVRDMGRRLNEALANLKEAEKLVKGAAMAPMNIFDRITKASKGKFRFEDLEKLAERAKESHELAENVVKGFHSVYNNSLILLGYIESRRWPVPERDDNMDILKQYKDESVKKGKLAGDIYKDAGGRLEAARKLYAEAEEALANQNSTR